MAHSSRRWLWPAVFLACLLAAGARSIAIGQDANWDLKNYHWYNVWALFHDRLGWDVAPAQLQTYHNPTGDLPFLALVSLLDSPRQVAFWMAASTGVAAYFLLRTLVLLFPAGRVRATPVWIAIAAAIGLTGAAGAATIGSTMNEWPSAALTMAALYLALRSIVEGEARRPRGYVAGAFLAGCAVGLKLTYGVFGLAFLVALAAFGGPRERGRRLVLGGLGMLAGFLAFYGWWGLTLWMELDNPFFPYFNSTFQSPWWEPVAFFDRNFGPRDWRQWIFFPLYFARQSTLVGEVGFRDYRLAALLVLALAALAKYRIGGLLGRDAALAGVAQDPVDRAWLFLGVFTTAAYLVWLKLFGIYRYLVPLEILAGPLIVACLLYLVQGLRARYAAVIVLGVLLVGTTRKGDWGRVPFGHAYFEVAAPELPPKSLVIVGALHPVAYVIPYFREDARFVAPANNLLAIGHRNRLAQRIDGLVRGHAGALFLLTHAAPLPDDLATLRHFGLEREDFGCRDVRSNLDYKPLQLCPLRRAAAPAS